MFFLLCKGIEEEIIEFVDKFLTAVFYLGLIGLMLYLGHLSIANYRRNNPIVLDALEAPKFTEPIVTNWQSEKEFVTVAPAERISELEIGRVIIKPIDDNVFFPVLIIPFQEIPTGTKVEIIELEALSVIPFRRSLIMLKPTESEKE